MFQTLIRFLKEEEGQDFAEYVLILLLFGSACFWSATWYSILKEKEHVLSTHFSGG